jgi:GYF domain 2
MTYLLTRGGQQYGPYEPSALQQMLAAGQVSQADLVWTEGMAAWEPISRVLPQSTPAPQQPVVVPAAGAGPIPSSMHWVVVLLLGAVTLGIFTLVWAFVEAGFVKKISPQRNGRTLLFLIFWIELIYMVVALLTTFFMHGSSDVPMPILGAVLFPLVSILAIVAIFRMRRGLLDYYNSVEPIQLRLSGAMTFFFSVYYFQHHLRRIAIWKTTGQLAPQ